MARVRLGLLELSHVSFQSNDDPHLRLVIYAPLPKVSPRLK
jgi:hypothetical protein